MIDFANQPTPTQVRDYYMLLRAGGDHMPKEARWKTCHHFGISMADFDKNMNRWKSAKERENRDKKKAEMVKWKNTKQRPPLSHEQAKEDYESMDDLPHAVRVLNIAAYYGETYECVNALIGSPANFKRVAKSQQPKSEPTEEEIRAACAKIREGWSQQVTEARQGVFYQPYVVPGTTIRHNLNGMSDGRKAWHDGDSEQN